MYKKMKKLNEKAIDIRLQCFCNDILLLNEDVFFAISKKFIENPDKSIRYEIIGVPVIVSSVPLESLTIPSGYSIKYNGYLTTWCDKKPLAKYYIVG